MTIIENGLSGALAAQVALATTSQNVANVMTAGYTRQAALFGSVQPLQGGTQSAGSGVTVQTILRFSDTYKDLQLWSSASNLAQHDVAQPYFTQLEQVMSDDASGLNSGLDDFFSALNAASVDPTSSPLRQQVITSADALAQRFNSLNQVFSNQRIAIQQQRLAAIQQINSLAGDIATLNKQIAQIQNTSANPSGLIDARSKKIDELAGLVAIQVVNQPDGTASVMLKGGQPLVASGRAATLSAQTTSSGAQNLTIQFAQETFALGSSGQLGGQLGGLDAYENGTLVPMMQSISAMAQQLTTNVNTQLAAGFTPAGTSGGPLFVYDTTGPTGVLRITTGITGGDLAFSANAATPGNSDNLLALINLKGQAITVPSLGSVSLSDAVTQLVGGLGTASQQNQASLSTAKTVRNQAEESWKSTSGVNSDEEAVNLVQYQQMYQANMKVISVANSLFDATLQAFG